MKHLEQWLLRRLKPSVRSIRLELETLKRDPSSVEFRYHPLGFIHARLAASPTATIRLHIWSNYSRPQDEHCQIHDHLFRFDSIVLVGRLRNIFYRFEENIHGIHQMYAARYSGYESRLEQVGTRGDLVPHGTTIWGAGDLYSVPERILHETQVNRSELTATILRTEVASEADPVVIVPIGHSASLTYDRQLVESVIVEDLLSLIINSMTETLSRS